MAVLLAAVVLAVSVETVAAQSSAGEAATNLFIPLCGIAALGFAYLMYRAVAKIQVSIGPSFRGGDIREFLDKESGENPADVALKAAEIQEAIAIGSEAFLQAEFKIMAYFMAGFSVVVFALVASADGFSSEWEGGRAPGIANGFFSALAFLLGAMTSIASAYLGMKIATFANARTTLEARRGIGPAFVVAFRSGAVMGFCLSGLGLFVLYLTLVLFRSYYGEDWVGLFEVITGYGLGGSSVALFGRVGGGIYTKAADVGADLVGKVEKDIPEDDPRNPAVIADNVGDNVGDIAGMGSDLFGSFAESTCAALVIASVSSFGAEHQWAAMMFPLYLTAAGILVCIFTSILATEFRMIKSVPEIEPTLKRQLIISTALMTPAVWVLCKNTLPGEFEIFVSETEILAATPLKIFYCVGSGLWSGLLIGLVTEYYTSHSYTPVREVADSCRTGAATNIIFGLALGYKSCIIPVLAIACTIYIAFSTAAMYGVACAALGMLGTLSTGLAIDAYGPISDNAGGIAEMSGMGEDIRERTDALDAAGNTTAAIGKGFAIGSAALVSLALFGAYVVRAGIDIVNVMQPREFAGLLVGAMLPYWFSAMTMKSVGVAALAMVEEVRRQFNTMTGIMEGTTKPDYKRCVAISTNASLKEMGPPGALVLLTPVIVGILFGPQTLAGVLAGALVSGVQMAISASNTGGAWDNAKKYLEAGHTEHARSIGGKKSDAHKAAVVGDTVGDPLKDTSGPALNILIKLMAVESLVFAPFFGAYGGLVFQLLE